MPSSLGDLRSAIESINREIMQEQGNGIVVNDEVLKRLKAQRPLLIREATPELLHSALVKMISEVGSRKGVRALGGERDLFIGYHGIPATVSIATNVRKATSQLTLREAYAALRPTSVRAPEERYGELGQMVEDCREYFVDESDTLETALRRKQAVTESDLL